MLIYQQGRNRHIFLRGQSHFSWFFFPDMKWLFPVKSSRFGRPKTNFRRFKKWKAKKKKKKKKSSPLFITFPTSISNFPPSLLQFYFFSSQFLPLFHFSLPLFSRYVSKNFPVRSLGGGHSAPHAPLPVTPLYINIITKILGPVAKFRCTAWLGGPWAAGWRCQVRDFAGKIWE